jgi:hypothetical protein
VNPVGSFILAAVADDGGLEAARNDGKGEPLATSTLNMPR